MLCGGQSIVLQIMIEVMQIKPWEISLYTTIHMAITWSTNKAHMARDGSIEFVYIYSKNNFTHVSQP